MTAVLRRVGASTTAAPGRDLSLHQMLRGRG
jgi:hypothetical protein